MLTRCWPERSSFDLHHSHVLDLNGESYRLRVKAPSGESVRWCIQRSYKSRSPTRGPSARQPHGQFAQTQAASEWGKAVIRRRAAPGKVDSRSSSAYPTLAHTFCCCEGSESSTQTPPPLCVCQVRDLQLGPSERVGGPDTDCSRRLPGSESFETRGANFGKKRCAPEGGACVRNGPIRFGIPLNRPRMERRVPFAVLGAAADLRDRHSRG